MLHVKHFVVEDVLRDKLWDMGMIHAAVEQDLIGAGIITAELAAPSAVAPAEMRATESPREIFSIQRVEHRS